MSTDTSKVLFSEGVVQKEDDSDISTNRQLEIHEKIGNFLRETVKLFPDSRITVGVHDGRFHADEVFAIAALKLLCQDVEVIRTRDENLLKDCDMRIDVGGKYDASTMDFDHHQDTFTIRHPSPRPRILENGSKVEWTQGMKRSGFGLIWLHYGIDIVKYTTENNCIPDVTMNFRRFTHMSIWEVIDSSLVAQIDAQDNGEAHQYYFDASPVRCLDVTKIIGDMNPTVMELMNLTADEIPSIEYHHFGKAVDLAVKILKNAILEAANDVWYITVFNELLNKMGPNDRIMVLPKFIPWAHAYSKAGNATNSVFMVVYPTTTGMWMCQTPRYYKGRDKNQYSATMSDGSKRLYKYPAPVEVRGKRDKDLATITGIDDAVFVHGSGHLGAAKSKEGAIKLAQYFITHAQK